MVKTLEEIGDQIMANDLWHELIEGYLVADDFEDKELSDDVRSLVALMNKVEARVLRLGIEY